VSEPEPHSVRVGVALSGGGHRATVWAFGVMLALIDSRTAADVVSVSSVSGGSFAHGVMAHDLRLPSTTAREADAAFAPMTEMIARQGLFLWGPSTNAYSWSVYSGLAVGAVALIGGLLTALGTHSSRWLVAASLGVLVLMIASYAAQRRGTVVDRALARLFFSRNGRTTPLNSVNRDVDHIFCATELQSGEHFYLSPTRVYSYAYGVGRPQNLDLSTVVQISACVPGGFPAHRLDTTPFGFRRQCTPRGIPSAPDLAVLVDGGVYDNLAEEWFTPPHGTRRETDNPEGRPRIDQLVVANASARDRWIPFRASRLPWLAELGEIARSEDVTFDATTALRRRHLVARWEQAGADGPTGALVHIAQSPYDVPDDVLRGSQDAHERARAAHAVAVLGDSAYRRAAWLRIVDSDGRVRTTLGKLGVEATADLLQHAYVLASVNLHVLLDRPLPDLPDRARFTALAQGQVPATG